MPGKPNLASCRFVRHRYKGIAVYFFMNRIVVPLSNATKYPFSAKMMLIGVVIHIFLRRLAHLPKCAALRRVNLPV
jgi:hypothetical protein